MEIQKKELAQTLEDMKAKRFNYLKNVTAVDYVDHLEVVYILYNLETKENETIQVRLDAENPTIKTIIKIFPAADWYERHMSEMFGIKITGRIAKRILLEGWNGRDFPLRKSFEWGKDYKKV